MIVVTSFAPQNPRLLVGSPWPNQGLGQGQPGAILAALAQMTNRSFAVGIGLGRSAAATASDERPVGWNYGPRSCGGATPPKQNQPSRWCASDCRNRPRRIGTRCSQCRRDQTILGKIRHEQDGQLGYARQQLGPLLPGRSNGLLLQLGIPLAHLQARGLQVALRSIYQPPQLGHEARGPERQGRYFQQAVRTLELVFEISDRRRTHVTLLDYRPKPSRSSVRSSGGSASAVSARFATSVE